MSELMINPTKTSNTPTLTHSTSDQSEKTFVKYSETQLPTLWGEFKTTVYRTLSGEEHVALSLGLDNPNENDPPPLVRIHSACFTSEVLGSLKCDCREQLHYALEKIQEEGRGVVVYLFQEGRGIGLGAKIKVYALQEQGLDTVDANTHLGYAEDARTYESALEILQDLGVNQARVLTNNPHKIQELGKGLAYIERVAIEVGSHPLSHAYLNTKRDRMGHLFSGNPQFHQK